MSRTGSSPTGGARWRRVAAALVVALTLLATACTAGTGGQGGNPPGGQQQAGDSSRYLQFFPCCAWTPNWSFNPFSVNGLGIVNDMVVMRLAKNNFPSLTEYTPQLAESWGAEGDTITVTLREDAMWQDDTPVTSTDIVDTVVLEGLRGGYWRDITDVVAVDDRTVEFTLREGSPATLVMQGVLGTRPRQSSFWGEYATDEIKRDLQAYYEVLTEDPAAAAEMEESQRINDAFQEVAAVEVDEVVGNGPFELGNITISQAKLEKWDGWWDADNIKFAGIDWYNGSNQDAYPQVLSGQMDFSTVWMPPAVLKQYQNTPDANLALPPSFGFVMNFNSSREPLDTKEVRQALAHVIPRPAVTEAAFGPDKSGGGEPNDILTGISPQAAELYLTPEQVGSLKRYETDPAQATALLEGAGFTQREGQWYRPDGERFTLSLMVNSAFTDIVAHFNSAAQALTAFGIQSEVQAIDGAQVAANTLNGDFDISVQFVGGANPLGQINLQLGPANNFPTEGAYAGKRGIGFGPTKDVPGLGEVNVSATINEQLRTIEPGEEMSAQTWNWVQLFNEEVPSIWYSTKTWQFAYSTRNFTNWPEKDPGSDTSAMWDLIVDDIWAGTSLAIQQGYITPR